MLLCKCLFKTGPKSLNDRSAAKSFPWLQINHSSQNFSKIYLVKFNANRSKDKVVIDEYTIDEYTADWVKFLGLHLDIRLIFQYHLSTVCNRNSKFGRISTTF